LGNGSFVIGKVEFVASVIIPHLTQVSEWPTAALRAGTRAKSKFSHGSVTPTPNKLMLTGNISHSLAGVELSFINSLPDITIST